MNVPLQFVPWFIAAVAVCALIGVIVAGTPKRKRSSSLLPADWTLAARPVFSTDERRVYRQLREAFPHHVVLAKLPLVRFCQPNDPQETRYWYTLLASVHVSFAICSANGRVLSVIDVENARTPSRRATQIKQAVMSACHVRYLRCAADQMPSTAELQLLVPHGGVVRGPHPAPAAALHAPRAPMPGTINSRRERKTLWEDSSFFHDSFFSPDSRDDTSPSSAFGSLTGARRGPAATRGSRPPVAAARDDGAGGVADRPAHGSRTTRH